MKRKRVVAGMLATVVLGGAVYLALLSFGVFAPVSGSPPVPAGHQEIVLLLPATSGESWERLVAAVDTLADEAARTGSGKPRLHVAKDRAFPALTAEVPEVCLWLEGCENARLWIRWCKLSSESNMEKWISRLTERPTPPLVVIGGDTTARAVKLAKALGSHEADWHGQPPLLFITTATADSYDDNHTPNLATARDKQPRLIDIYKDRSFRFSFTNSRMAAALLNFVRLHHELWPGMLSPAQTAGAAAAASAAATGPVSAAVLATAANELFTTYLYTVQWDDDSFSADLADGFGTLFPKMFAHPRVSPYHIEYSVGDFYQPNPQEAFVVGQLVPELKMARDHRQLLLVPADAERARRFLRTVVRRTAPADVKNLVILAGDSLNFNAIFRDRNVAWNIQDLPLPVVIFSHRNPVAEDVGFRPGAGPAGTGTEDLLLYRDILETLLLTAYQDQRLSVCGDDLARALHRLSWSAGRVRAAPPGGQAAQLFTLQDGNRMAGAGEHIIVLRPDSEDRGLLAQAVITVWHLESDGATPPAWREVRTLTVTYDGLTP